MRRRGPLWTFLQIYVQVDEVSGPRGPFGKFMYNSQSFGVPWALSQIHLQDHEFSGSPGPKIRVHVDEVSRHMDWQAGRPAKRNQQIQKSNHTKGMIET